MKPKFHSKKGLQMDTIIVLTFAGVLVMATIDVLSFLATRNRDKNRAKEIESIINIFKTLDDLNKEGSTKKKAPVKKKTVASKATKAKATKGK